eukprot:TRINITY_DN7101_c0_g1_i1.p1 TRINITY_DN7101_c0_g1~~TRINITY_DN7101_c0_g1_i1.p1  ORF type:complete len:222 (-),score=41.63 TRINITY_DN7101_c0_g1_i1:21-686(-)
MTWFHFFNCAGMTLLPPFIVYKSTDLAEHQAWKACLYSALIFILTKFVQMLAVATFLPSETDEFSITLELMKTLVNVADLVGVNFILTRTKFTPQVRVLAVGLGWMIGDAVVSKLPQFWVSARGLEFDYKHIQMGVDANINMIAFPAMAALLWLVNRKSVPEASRKMGTTLLVVFAALPVVLSFLEHALHLSQWIVLAVRAAASVAIALPTRGLFEKFKSS